MKLTDCKVGDRILYRNEREDPNHIFEGKIEHITQNNYYKIRDIREGIYTWVFGGTISAVEYGSKIVVLEVLELKEL